MELSECGAKWEVRSQKVEEKYIVGPHRHCEDAMVWEERGSFCGLGRGTKDLTYLLYSITLAVKLEVDSKKARAIMIIWMSDGDNLVQEK